MPSVGLNSRGRDEQPWTSRPAQAVTANRLRFMTYFPQIPDALVGLQGGKVKQRLLCGRGAAPENTHQRDDTDPDPNDVEDRRRPRRMPRAVSDEAEGTDDVEPLVQGTLAVELSGRQQ